MSSPTRIQDKDFLFLYNWVDVSTLVSALSFCQRLPPQSDIGCISLQCGLPLWPRCQPNSWPETRAKEERFISHSLDYLFFLSFIQGNWVGCKVTSFSPLILEGHWIILANCAAISMDTAPCVLQPSHIVERIKDYDGEMNRNYGTSNTVGWWNVSFPSLLFINTPLNSLQYAAWPLTLGLLSGCRVCDESVTREMSGGATRWKLTSPQPHT